MQFRQLICLLLGCCVGGSVPVVAMVHAERTWEVWAQSESNWLLWQDTYRIPLHNFYILYTQLSQQPLPDRSALPISEREPLKQSNSLIFATYSHEHLQGRVWIQKIERFVDGRIHQLMADFTPHHGAYWQRSQHYPDGKGGFLNPFTSFQGAWTDPVFYQCNWRCFQGVLSHAVALYQAPFAAVSAIHMQFDEQVTHQRNLLRTKKTHSFKALAKADFYIAWPDQFLSQPSKETASACTNISCSLDQTLPASLQWMPFKGGNLKIDPVLLHQWQYEQRSLSFLAQALLSGTVLSATALGLSHGLAILPGQINPMIVPFLARGFSEFSVLAKPAGFSNNYLESKRSNSTFDVQRQVAKDQLHAQHIKSLLGNALVPNQLFYQGDCASQNKASQCHEGQNLGVTQRDLHISISPEMLECAAHTCN